MPVFESTLRAIVAGSEYSFTLSSVGLEFDFTSVPAVLYLDPPLVDGVSTGRIVIKHLNGGPSLASQSGKVVTFKLTPAQTFAMAVGVWQATVCIGTPGVDIKADIPRNVLVIKPIGGGIPQS